VYGTIEGEIESEEGLSGEKEGRATDCREGEEEKMGTDGDKNMFFQREKYVPVATAPFQRRPTATTAVPTATR
jgi:hypothetical protein